MAAHSVRDAFRYRAKMNCLLRESTSDQPHWEPLPRPGAVSIRHRLVST
jgi:hypothetical protein